MPKKLTKWIIAGLVLTGLGIMFSGCATGVLRETSVRSLPREIAANISIGDTRQEVRSLLGKPFIDVRSLGLEAYRRTGRDLNFVWIIYPFPDIGEKATVGVLVVYDENDKVADIATDIILKEYYPFQIHAGGFHLIKAELSEPDTLLGPPLSWNELAGMGNTGNSCSLILVMCEWAMEQVSLDDDQIVDLVPYGSFCRQFGSGLDYVSEGADSCDGTFIQRNIPPGSHRIHVHRAAKSVDFETAFECGSGETVYVELDATLVPDTFLGFRDGYRLEGNVAISKTPTENVIQRGALCPILWHQGTWYGPPSLFPE